MLNYNLLKKFLFSLNPETAHKVALGSLSIAHGLGLTRFFPKVSAPRKVFGLHFPNPIGLAAGLDKNGDYIDALAALGFGFIEIGTVTPKPQEGNPAPRLFRLTSQNALINRMGFNNKGVDYVVERLQRTSYQGILGINIGKNRDTPIEKALDDYVENFRRLAPFASYIAINISSPNTPELRNLQHGETLQVLLKTLKEEQLKQKKYVPLIAKIAPDLLPDEVQKMAEIFLAERIDGVIATNTTVSREGVENSPYVNEPGGLSGKPLGFRSTRIIQQLQAVLLEQVPIIGCGGIFNPDDVTAKMAAGAKLIQIYTGLIYRGPKLISELGNFIEAL